MGKLGEAFKEIAVVELKIWEELYKKYSKEIVEQTASKTVCGCATCTKNLLENNE